MSSFQIPGRRERLPEASHPEAGFTLVEVTVATVVTGLVVVVATAAYLLGARAMTRWERDLALDADVHLAEAALARDLRRAETATHAGPDSLVLVTGRTGLEESDRIAWAVRDSVLYRDTVRVHGPEVRATAFEARLAPSDEVDGARRETVFVTDETDLDRTSPSVQVRFALQGRSRTVDRTLTHAWRTPERWPTRSDSSPELL
ncbi:MAG: prepilin-type N-terminal cleavage/methylation domain-containing protein [Bacteroidota bacterium]